MVKFKRAVVYGPNNVVVESVSLPRIPGYELRNHKDIAKIAVSYCGICGTDVKIYRDPSFDLLAKTWWQKLGHEWVGRILELNTRNTKLKIGDRVVGGPPMGGAFSEVAYVPLLTCWEVAKSIDDLEAIFAEPITVVLRYFRYGEELVNRAKRIAIFGGGPIGLLVLQILRRINPRSIIWGIENATLKSEKFKELGAAEVFSNFNHVPANKIDLIIDCIGNRALLMKYFKLLKSKGTLIPIGTAEHVSLSPIEWKVFQEKKLNVFVGHTRRYARHSKLFEEALNILKKREIDTRNLVTKIIPLTDLVEEGLRTDRGRDIKIAVKCI